MTDGRKFVGRKLRKLYGKDYYARLGAMGGNAPHNAPRGFAANRELASSAGKKGGRRRWLGKAA